MGEEKVDCVSLCYFFFLFVFGNCENDSPMSVHKASKQVVSVGTEASCVARVLSLLFCVRFLRGTLPGTSFYANSWPPTDRHSFESACSMFRRHVAYEHPWFDPLFKKKKIWRLRAPQHTVVFAKFDLQWLCIRIQDLAPIVIELASSRTSTKYLIRYTFSFL